MEYEHKQKKDLCALWIDDALAERRKVSDRFVYMLRVVAGKDVDTGRPTSERWLKENHLRWILVIAEGPMHVLESYFFCLPHFSTRDTIMKSAYCIYLNTLCTFDENEVKSNAMRIRNLRTWMSQKYPTKEFIILDFVHVEGEG